MPGVDRAAGRPVTVSGVDGATLTLVTSDGWTRTVDTTNVPIARDGTAITIADVRVGDTVRIVQRRADDGTWQVTRLQVLPTVARGTVTQVGTDGFVLSTRDGSEVTVRVSDATTWPTGCQPTTALDTLRVGDQVAVRGVSADDGSIDATMVATAGQPLRPRTRGEMRRQTPGEMRHRLRHERDWRTPGWRTPGSRTPGSRTPGLARPVGDRET